ncbi:putative receptor protein kinase ZmPK1 [Miscanthus floridulus]|uniref:putative receptor protein kinase ZmPK1 n=1 Tax=Miscanthus floridulus TaxID=154761 RepID=UPI0034589C50
MINEVQWLCLEIYRECPPKASQREMPKGDARFPANTAGGLAHTSYLKKGSSLSVNRASDIIQSPDGTFSFGFYNLSSTAFTICIWFTTSADRTIAWSANRNHPVYGSGSEVRLNKDGTMVLTDYDGTVVWQTNTSSKGADYAELMDSGNLVMKNQGGNILWQSFDHPTDTLLPTQPVTASAKLVSTDLPHPSSYYTLRFDDRYILSLAYDGPDISNLYWPNPDFSSWLNYRISYNGRGEVFLITWGSLQQVTTQALFQQIGVQVSRGD